MSSRPYVVEFDPVTNELHARFGEACIEMAERGDFPAAWCVHLGISTSTFRSWRTRYPEFREATDRAKAILQAFMERKALDHIEKRGFQGQVWAKMMMAHFAEDYTERREIKSTNIDGGTDDLARLTDEELDEQIAKHEGARAARQAARADLTAARKARTDGDG